MCNSPNSCLVGALSEMLVHFTDLKTFYSDKVYGTVSAACEYPMSRLWLATLIITALSSLCTTKFHSEPLLPYYYECYSATNLENCSICCMSTVAERDKSQEGWNVGKVQVCVWIELVHVSSVACLPHWLVWGLDVLRVIECPQGHIWPLGIFFAWQLGYWRARSI